MSREAMTLALEALELLARYENPETKIQNRKKDGGPIVTIYPHKVASDAAQVLRAALDAPELEWQGLTDEEIHECFCHVEYETPNDWVKDPEAWCIAFTRIVEAKLRMKNG